MFATASGAIAVAKQPVPRGQHLVPRMHLQHFAAKAAPCHVWTYSKADGRVFHAIAEETGKQSHFYSIERDDGTFDTTIEDHLSQIEGVAAPIYERLLQDGPAALTPQDKADFAHFAALLSTRTAAARRDAAEIIGRSSQILSYAYGQNDSAFDSMIRKVETERGEKIPEDVKAKVREWMQSPSSYDVEVPKERTLVALEASDKLSEILYDMHWTVLRVEHGFLVTSDNPLTRQVDRKTVHPLYGDHGFMNKTAQVTVPLSPNAALLMRWDQGGHLAQELTIDRRQVVGLNKTRAYYADEYLYAHLEHKGIQRLARDHRDTRPRMTTEGFGPKEFGKVSVPRRWPGKGSSRKA